MYAENSEIFLPSQSLASHLPHGCSCVERAEKRRVTQCMSRRSVCNKQVQVHCLSADQSATNQCLGRPSAVKHAGIMHHASTQLQHMQLCSCMQAYVQCPFIPTTTYWVCRAVAIFAVAHLNDTPARPGSICCSPNAASSSATTFTQHARRWQAGWYVPHAVNA